MVYFSFKPMFWGYYYISFKFRRVGGFLTKLNSIAKTLFRNTTLIFPILFLRISVKSLKLNTVLKVSTALRTDESETN